MACGRRETHARHPAGEENQEHHVPLTRWTPSPNAQAPSGRSGKGPLSLHGGDGCVRPEARLRLPVDAAELCAASRRWRTGARIERWRTGERAERRRNVERVGCRRTGARIRPAGEPTNGRAATDRAVPAARSDHTAAGVATDDSGDFITRRSNSSRNRLIMLCTGHAAASPSAQIVFPSMLFATSSSRSRSFIVAS